MNPLLAFLLGFIAASAIALYLVWSYYQHARKRVQAMKEAISQRQQADSLVNQAISNTKFPNPSTQRTPVNDL